MQRISRFECASSLLSLNPLLAKTRYALWVCLGVGVLAHFALTRATGPQTEQRAAKPLTTRFVKRQPRLTKPLEMKKKPRPRQRPIQRRMVSVEARGDRDHAAPLVRDTRWAQCLAKPSAALVRSTAVAATGMEPQDLTGIIDAAREPKHKMDMQLDLLDVNALDTGQYHAMIIQDPSDKKNVRGYFHLAVIFSETMVSREKERTHARKVVALATLVKAINKYTRIRAELSDSYTFDSRELFKTPWILACTYIQFRLTASEAHNLGRYMCHGGFVFSDDFIGTRDGPGDRYLRTMLRDALTTQGMQLGRDWQFEILPNDHPIYHCFFDFPQGPPMGNDFLNIINPSAAEGREPYPYLHGINIEKRLVAIHSVRAYMITWSDWGKSNAYSETYRTMDPTRQLQFGVNLVVFALTQEGSITHRVMDAMW